MRKMECELCEEKRSLKKHLGKNVCSRCQAVMTAAKNKPETVKKALEAFGCKTTRNGVGVSFPPAILERIDRLEGYAEKMKVLDGAHEILFGFSLLNGKESAVAHHPV